MDEKLKLCLVGCGRVSHSHFEGIGELKDMIDLVAVVDIDEERAKQATKAYGAKKYYLSTAEAFEDPEVEAVDLCLPHDQHRSVTIEAANMGKHILVEKPMANTVKEVDQMVEAADRNNVTLMVGQSRRFYDTVMKSKQLIEEGQIGHLFSIRANYLGCVTEPVVPWWSSDRIKGLIIPLFGSHLIDYVLWVKDNPVTRVYAETYSNNPVWNGGEDEVSILLGFDDGSAANISMSWNVCDQKPRETEDDRMMSTGGFLYNRYLIGSKGYLLLIDETELRLNGNLFMRSEQKLTNFALELKEFVDSIRQKREPLTSGRKNRAVIQVLEVTRKSAERHSLIEIV